MEDIKVSVIVPTYKRSVEILDRALQSLFAQTYENIEIVICDDNAKEGLEEYRKNVLDYVNSLNSDKILYLPNEVNLGSAKNRNHGIESATGSIIAFLDDDDTFRPDKIENQVKYMVDIGLDASFDNQILVNNNREVVDYREHRRIKAFDNKSLMQYHLTRKITGTNTMMATKELLMKIGGFNGSDMGDEFYLMHDIIKSGCKIGYCDHDGVVAYRAEETAGLTLGETRLRDEKKVFDLIKSNYSILTFRQRCYARFRYNVTKLMTYKRAKKYGKMLGAMICAFFSDPISFFVEPLRMKKNVSNAKKVCDGKQ